MTKNALGEIEKTKRRNFNRRFGKLYGVKLLELQCHANPQGQCFVDVDFMFPTHVTAEEIGHMCDSVAGWIGGRLYGTVNLDFSGKSSLSIVVELKGR